MDSCVSPYREPYLVFTHLRRLYRSNLNDAPLSSTKFRKRPMRIGKQWALGESSKAHQNGFDFWPSYSSDQWRTPHAALPGRWAHEEHNSLSVIDPVPPNYLRSNSGTKYEWRRKFNESVWLALYRPHYFLPQSWNSVFPNFYQTWAKNQEYNIQWIYSQSAWATESIQKNMQVIGCRGNSESRRKAEIVLCTYCQYKILHRQLR